MIADLRLAHKRAKLFTSRDGVLALAGWRMTLVYKLALDNSDTLVLVNSSAVFVLYYKIRMAAAVHTVDTSPRYCWLLPTERSFPQLISSAAIASPLAGLPLQLPPYQRYRMESSDAMQIKTALFTVLLSASAVCASKDEVIAALQKISQVSGDLNTTVNSLSVDPMDPEQ